MVDLGEHIGSNNWVAHGERTWTGLPLIVNDPHRTIVAPSLRYFVHLKAPGWDVIGGGEPVLPGLSIGHNEKGGWGLTVFGQDNEDLMVYDTNPDDRNQYRYLGHWESMTVRTETIEVKGAADHQATLKYTRHGPVVYEDTENNKAYALRAAWLEIGNSPYLASLRMDQAQTWEEFVEACNYSGIPAENMIWGDVDGNIGYQAVGVSADPERELERTRPRPRGRALRVAGIPADQGAARRQEPRKGLLGHREQPDGARRGLPLPPPRGPALHLG